MADNNKGFVGHTVPTIKQQDLMKPSVAAVLLLCCGS